MYDPAEFITKYIINMGSCRTNVYGRLESTSNDLLARVKVGMKNPAAFSGKSLKLAYRICQTTYSQFSQRQNLIIITTLSLIEFKASCWILIEVEAGLI